MEIINAIRGDDHYLSYVIKDSEGTAVDVSGWGVKITVREALPAVTITDDSDAKIAKTQVITDGTSGAFSVLLTNVETNIASGYYYMDTQFTNASGIVASAPVCKIHIIADVTRS